MQATSASMEPQFIHQLHYKTLAPPTSTRKISLSVLPLEAEHLFTQNVLPSAMRHFTHEWVQSGWEPDTVRAEAAAYFDSIAHRLIPSIHNFREAVNLHDAHVHRISFDAASDVVSFEVSELFWNDQLKQGSRRTLLLTYSGNVSVEVFSGSEQDHARYPLWEDDLIIDEWDTDEQRLEHRMLFASGSELHVKFLAFNFHHPSLLSNEIPAATKHE